MIPFAASARPASTSRNMPIVAFRFPGAISVHWFIYLRWVAVLGQLLTVLAVHYGFGIELHLGPLLLTIAVTALSNLFLTAWSVGSRKRRSEASQSRLWAQVLATVMAVDLLLLTCLLYFSGGPANPFWIFYLVNLCLAGIELTAWVAWCLNFLAVFCFAFLLFDHYPLELQTIDNALPSIRQTGMVTLLHNGVFCAFSTCASVIVFFTTLVTSKLRRREEELRILEARRIRGEKLEALGTLAAGAAHELATPLGTIAVIVGELQREIDQKVSDPELIEDVRQIRSELDRCRAILNHMSAQAGEGTIEKKVPLTGQQLLEQIRGVLKNPERVEWHIDPTAACAIIVAEPYVTAQALRGTIKNAIEASPPDNLVNVQLACTDKLLVLSVADRGTGMPAHILTRIGEPFFTTKQTGKGMGLGVFLARSVVERLGGEMQVHSEPGQGTQVRCLIPCTFPPTDG